MYTRDRQLAMPAHCNLFVLYKKCKNSEVKKKIASFMIMLAESDQMHLFLVDAWHQLAHSRKHVVKSVALVGSVRI